MGGAGGRGQPLLEVHQVAWPEAWRGGTPCWVLEGGKRGKPGGMSGNLVPRWVKRTYQDKQVGKARALLGHREAAAAEHRDGWGRFIYVKQSKSAP
jgi:hypothetical protein